MTRMRMIIDVTGAKPAKSKFRNKKKSLQKPKKRHLRKQKLG